MPANSTPARRTSTRAGMILLAMAWLTACSVPERRRPTTQPAPPASQKETSAQRAAAKPAWVARKVVADGRAVPGGRQHVVKQGETGIAIAQAYGVAWREVVTANQLVPPYLLRVGDRLLIPMPKQASARAPSLEDRARGFRLDIDDIVTGGEPATAANKQTAAPDLAANAPSFRWPVEGRIISGFGPKSGGRFNDGVNFRIPAGTPVRAAADGTVAYAGDAIPGFGNLLLIRHAGGWVTAYGHNEALLVERGKQVRTGEVIARSGATGQVTEPQLHFEIRRGRTALDPQTLAR